MTCMIPHTMNLYSLIIMPEVTKAIRRKVPDCTNLMNTAFCQLGPLWCGNESSQFDNMAQ